MRIWKFLKNANRRSQPARIGMIAFATICAVSCAGCRAPWQVNANQDLDVTHLLDEEEAQAPRRQANERSRSLASRLRSRGGAPSPAARKTGARQPLLKSSPKNAIEKMLGKTSLASKQESGEAPKPIVNQSIPEEELTIKERIAMEMLRREKIRKAQTDLEESDSDSDVRVKLSDFSETTSDKGTPVRTAAGSSPKASAKPASAKKIIPNTTAVAAEKQPKEASIEELGEELLEHLGAREAQADRRDEKIEMAKRKRLVHFALGDLDSAKQPIEGLDEESQEFMSHTLQGLHEATAADGNPSTGQKLSRALKSHREATTTLSTVASLEIKNVAFCTEIDGFGEIKKFKSYRFRPDQQVLLYSELENFVSQETSEGFRTKLQGNYEIIDAAGKRVMEQVLPEDTDLCAQRRRDFYIAYRFHLPRKIAAGSYKLRLVIEDMQGHKFGQTDLSFEIVD